MSRNYSISHSAPRELGGQKMIALIDDQTSQLDFSLLKGIGSSPMGSASLILGHLAIGTQTQASKIESLHPFVSIGGVYVDYAAAQASPVASGQGKIAHISNWGEVFVTSQPKSSSTIGGSGSADNVKSSSGIVYEFGVAWSDCNTGNIVRLTDNGTGVRAIVFNATSGNQWVRLPDGGIPISTSITVQKTITGGAGASIFISYL